MPMSVGPECMVYSLPALLLVDCDSPADMLCAVSSCLKYCKNTELTRKISIHFNNFSASAIGRAPGPKGNTCNNNDQDNKDNEINE